MHAMKRSFISLAIPAFLTLQTPAHATDPAWWSDRGVVNTSPASNLSPATIGQAKHIVSMALAELQTRLAPADYQALQTAVGGIVNLALPQNQAEYDNQKQVLLVGQLKAMARPFYDQLRILDAAWVNNQMYQLNTRVVEPGSNPITYSPYPWSVATSDDSNYSPATVGQLKAAFSLQFEAWGIAEPGDPPLPVGPTDSDGDGLSDLTEAAMGTSPTLVDTDGDGHPDADDVFPLDSARWSSIAAVSGDLSPPLLVLDSPATAVYQAGP
jgi:hypothetical protein